MSELRKAAEQALAFTMRDFATVQNFAAARAVLHDTLKAALEQPEPEPVAVVAMDVSRLHMYYGGKYIGQKPDTKIAMLLKDLPVGTCLFTAPPQRKPYKEEP
jgi:hypothetical protein